jgi:hypothetical protein
MDSIFMLKKFAIASHQTGSSMAGSAMTRAAANPRHQGIFAPA